jgi:hypothetical protein
MEELRFAGRSFDRTDTVVARPGKFVPLIFITDSWYEAAVGRPR